LALVVQNRDLAAEMAGILDGHLERSWRIDARGFPAGASERYPGVPKRKLLELRLYRLLAPLVKGQL
jgi:hypothetical protein